VNSRPAIAVLALCAIGTIAAAANQIARTVRGSGGFGGATPQHALHSTVGQSVVGVAVASQHTVRSGFWSPGQTPSDIEPDASTPERFALHLGGPNPFRDQTKIHFDVPAGGGSVRIDLFDVAGRHVRSLLDGPVTAGRQVVVWDGRDERGYPVGLGIYLCRMDAPKYTETRKLVVTN
jgi:hypothetical protein